MAAAPVTDFFRCETGVKQKWWTQKWPVPLSPYVMQVEADGLAFPVHLVQVRGFKFQVTGMKSYVTRCQIQYFFSFSVWTASLNPIRVQLVAVIFQGVQ